MFRDLGVLTSFMNRVYQGIGFPVSITRLTKGSRRLDIMVKVRSVTFPVGDRVGIKRGTVFAPIQLTPRRNPSTGRGGPYRVVHGSRATSSRGGVSKTRVTIPIMSGKIGGD